MKQSTNRCSNSGCFTSGTHWVPYI